MTPVTPVSFDSEELVLVTPDDREVGYATKGACHDGDGRLHRAFSLFVFDASGRLLVQRRADSKRLWGGFWSNSCCSHPRRGETLTVATARRLEQELGLRASLEFLFKFEYQARFGEAGSEHELCHVFVGAAQGTLRVHPDEISEVRWLTAIEVTRELARAPSNFTPWFKLEWQRLTAEHLDALTRLGARLS